MRIGAGTPAVTVALKATEGSWQALNPLVVMFGGQEIFGATVIAVTVGSLSAAVTGSSVRIGPKPVPLRLPWFVTEEVFTGKLVLMVTSNVMLTTPPGGSEPRERFTWPKARWLPSSSVAKVTHRAGPRNPAVLHLDIEIIFM